METTKHFGQHFRKQRKNSKMMQITSLAMYLQIYAKLRKLNEQQGH